MHFYLEQENIASHVCLAVPAFVLSRAWKEMPQLPLHHNNTSVSLMPSFRYKQAHAATSFFVNLFFGCFSLG
jgi:hypothetical protein